MAIEKTYLLGKNITLGCGFDLQAKAPLDSRQIVPEYAGLQALIDGNAAYEGMIVYDEETKKTYQAQLVDGVLTFREFGINEAELKDLIASETTAAMEFKGVASALPEAGAKGDMYKVSAAFDVAEGGDAQAEGFSAKVGDIIVCNGEGKWFLIPSGDDIEDTWRPVTDVNNDAALTFAAGDKIDVAVATNGTVTYSHEAIDAPVDVTAEGDEKTRTYITAVETDGFGHITGYKTATENVEDTNTTYAFEGQSEEATSVYFQVTSSEEGATAEVVYLDAYSKNEADAELAKKLDKSVYEAYIAGKAMSDEELKQYADEAAKVFVVELDDETGKASSAAMEIFVADALGKEVFVRHENVTIRLSEMDTNANIAYFSGAIVYNGVNVLVNVSVAADFTYTIDYVELADKDYVDASKTLFIAMDAEAVASGVLPMTGAEIKEAWAAGRDVVLVTLTGLFRLNNCTWSGETLIFTAVGNAADLGDPIMDYSEIRVDMEGKFTVEDIELATKAVVDAIEDRVEVLEAYKTSNDEALAGVKATAEAAATKAEFDEEVARAKAAEEANAAAAKAADDKAAQAQNEVDVLEAYVGTFVHDTAKSVVEYINAKTDGVATSGNLEALGSRVSAIEGAIATKAEQTALDEAVEALENADSAQEERIAALEDKFGDGDGSVEDMIADAQKAAEDYADGLNTAMNTRVEALEAIDHEHANKAELDLIVSGDKAKWDEAAGKAHEHANAEVLNGISAEKVSAWDSAEQNAKDYADEQFAKAKSVVVTVAKDNGDGTGTASMTSAEIAAAVQNGNDVGFMFNDYGLRLTRIVDNIAYFGANINFTDATNDIFAGAFIYLEVAVDADGKYTTDMVGIATSKDVNEMIGEVSEGKTVVEMIFDAQDAAEGHADGLNSAMNARVEALEAIDHEHSNADVLNGISAEKVEAWDAAVQLADIAVGSANGTISVKGTDVAVKGLGSAAFTEASAYDAAGAAEAAEANAKADASNKDAVVLAEAQKGIAQSLTDANAYTDAAFAKFVEIGEAEINALFA